MTTNQAAVITVVSVLVGYVLGFLYLGPAFYDWIHDDFTKPVTEVDYIPRTGPPCIESGCPGPQGPGR